MMESKLEQLKKITTVVADTGDIESIRAYRPEDVTTNPSLLLKAAYLPHYHDLLLEAKSWAASQGGDDQTRLENAVDKFGILVGKEMLAIVPGHVSTEVDARLSFNAGAMIKKANRLVELYELAGIPAERVLIKLASTWEGIQAAKILQKEGIKCNLTLLFCMTQAAACADAGVYLISPFVGRILDWHLKATGKDSIAPTEDPGVLSVQQIYKYYKTHQFDTIVMGASFRTKGEIEQLAGCDRLTIAPALLEELDQDHGVLKRQLGGQPIAVETPPPPMTEAAFRWGVNADPMATEKLAEGIRNFAADQQRLETMIQADD